MHACITVRMRRVNRAYLKPIEAPPRPHLDSFVPFPNSVKGHLRDLSDSDNTRMTSSNRCALYLYLESITCIYILLLAAVKIALITLTNRRLTHRDHITWSPFLWSGDSSCLKIYISITGYIITVKVQCHDYIIHLISATEVNDLPGKAWTVTRVQ